MRIARIALKDFGPYSDAEVILDQSLSIFRGDNAQGKSKAAQSIQLSLTGQSYGTDARGAGAQDKIRTGADKAILTLDLETAKGPMRLVTQYGPGKNPPQKIIAGSGGPETDNLAAGFSKFLEVSGQRLSCCLDSEFFIGEKAADQRAILAGVILSAPYDFDANPEDAKMKAMADKYLWKLEDNPSIPNDQRKRVPATNWKRSAPVVIDEVYGSAKSGVYSLRTAAKATLEGIYIPPTPTKPEHDANEVQAKLNVLRTQQTKEAKKVKQGGTVQVGRVEQGLTQEREKLAKAQADLTAARAKRDAIEAELLDGPTMTAHKQQAAKRNDYEALGKQIADLDAEIAMQSQAQDLFNELLVDEQGQPVDECPCPTCTQTVTRQFIAGKVEFHQNIQKTAGAEKAKLERCQKELGDIAGAEAALKRQEEKTKEKLAWVQTVTAATERITFIEAAIKDLEASLATAKAAEANPIDTTALDSLTAELATWEGRLAPAVQYDSTIKTIAEANARRDAQQAIVSELETLCSFFGPKGIKSRLIDEHIGAFSEKVNEVLAVWGYTAKLSIEPYSFEVRTPKTGDKYLPLKELSGFERKAFAVALQSAIAVFSKIKMILIDAADVMVAAQRNKLLGCVKLMLDNGTLEQAVVFIADPSRQVPVKPGVAFYFIEGGKIERL